MSAMEGGARAQILNGIRRSLRRGELAGPAREAVEARLAAPPRGPSVARAQLPQPEKVALFCQWAETNNATVARVPASEVAGEVSAYLIRNNLPAEAAMAPSPLLDRYEWAEQKMLALRRGRGEGRDQVSITGAFAGIAETGTLVMVVRTRSSGIAEPFARHPHRGAARGRRRRRLRRCLGAAAGALRQECHAANREHHHGAFAHRRHRAGHGTRRARAAPDAHRRGPRMTAAGGAPLPPRKGELRIVGTSVTREIELMLDRVADTVGRRAPQCPAGRVSVVSIGSQRTKLARAALEALRGSGAFHRHRPGGREQRRSAARYLQLAQDDPTGIGRGIVRPRGVLPRAGTHHLAVESRAQHIEPS